MQAKNLRHKLYAGLILKSTEFQLTLCSLKTLEEPREEEWGLTMLNCICEYVSIHCFYIPLLKNPENYKLM